MKHSLTILALAGSLFASGAAQAQQAADAGGYLLGAFGQSSFDVDCTGASSCDKNGSALKLVGGYRMASGIALEGVLMNFGKATARDTGLDVTLKIQAIGVGAAFSADLSPSWIGTLRLGIASVKTTGEVSGILSGSESERKTKPYFGLGLGYKIAPNMWIEGGLDSTRGEIEGDDGTVSAVSIGLGIRF
jgi:OOP family OmpA-OmpF porin